MSTRLELPPPRELPTERRREIRAALVRASYQRRHPRRWLVAVPVTVLALLLGLGLGLTRPWEVGTPVVGVPAGTPSLPVEPTPDRTTPSPTPAAPVVPVARETDGGPLSAKAHAKVVDRCLAELDRSTTVTHVYLARRTAISGDVVMFTAADGESYSCSSKDGSGLFDGPGSKTLPLPTPDDEHPALLVDGEGLWTASGKGRVDAHTSAAYRVSDEVASLQTRLSIDGHTGSWFEASRAGGWAWTGATLEYEGTLKHSLQQKYRIDVRAFDADGKRLAVDRTPR